jgi:hypothetical protein
MSERLATISLALLLLLAGYCAAQTIDPRPIRVGDRWSYDIKDDLTGDLRHAITVVVGEVNDKEITTLVTARGKDRPRTMVYDLDWGRIDDGVWMLRPSGIGIRKPLQIGQEWRSDANGINLRSDQAFRAAGVAKVVGREQVTVPAGTFDTFRVEMTVRAINTRDQSILETWTFRVWYAPEVNRWVRRETAFRFEGRLRDSFSEELTGYSRKP